MSKTNVAFKCNFCNGGRTNTNYGFNGVCSKDVIEYNIRKAKYDWCSQPQCDCNRYYKKKISYEELQEIYKKEGSVCYESSMLNDWKALAGYNNNGIRAGEARTIKNAEIGSLAVLTLVTPNDSEYNRRIFALFLIDDYYEGGVDTYSNESEGYVACNSKYKLNFTRSETNELMFWDYYSNENTPECRWSSGLFRYFEDEQAAQILKQAALIKTGTGEESLARDFLEYYCKTHSIKITEIQSPSGSKIKK
ncbi:MAG TPA: hypothetical protein VEB00_02620 [Clostridia bacterium]|nr:hypothetical protein [Clostridia bacterium]